jgi:biotin carboxylase
MNDADGVLLVLASGSQPYREYLIGAAARHCRLWLFDPDPPSWQRRHVAGHTVLNVFDPAEAIAAARELGRSVAIRGVYCYHEAAILSAALVAEELGLPAPSAQAVRAVRDKNMTRALLTRAGIRQPQCALAASLREAELAAERLGFPLVAKPRNLGSSQGVVKVGSRAELAAAFEISRSEVQAGMEHCPEVILEEFLDGAEISVDAVVSRDGYQPYLIAHKQLGGSPWFEEVGHTILADEPLFADGELMKMLTAAHQAVGWHHGITHTEVKLTPAGPVIVEINGRLGGDLIPYIGQLATGIDSGLVSTDLALGVPPLLRRTRQATTAIRFLRPPASATVRRIELPVADRASGLLEAVALVRAGTRLLMPPEGYVGRYGYLIAQGASSDDCDAVLDRAERATAVEYES